MMLIAISCERALEWAPALVYESDIVAEYLEFVS